MAVESFGKRICRLRKQANMTQRELANLLGISEPAVCKWETDSSMPDIMLLAPLARALHTDLNTLLSYEEQLSPEQVKAFGDTAEEIGQTEGADAEMLYWKEKFREYPNSELLTMACAKWLTKLQVQGTATGEQMQILEELLVKLCKSEEAEMKFEAKRYLASFYITGQRFEEAETILSTLPEFDFNARHLKALLLYVQKDYESARKECEQFLFECVQNALICLSRMAGIAVATGDKEKERTYAEMMCRMEQELGIPFYRGATQMMEYCLHSGEEEEAAKCFEAYVENVLHAEDVLRDSVFFGDLGEDIRFISNGALVSLEEFREELVRVMQNPRYMRKLRGNEKAKESMEKLKLYMGK
ncbi:MAG: helix-turn-helix transcriptional regulator [Lachnospiraceae bacterium]|nr:helix-turn-helix transcriptional regulator [Lachnospiraceae bacterium]